jgi:hypothetical protein
MAKPKCPNHLELRYGLDRRQLLASATAISVANVMPSAGSADAPPLAVLPSLPPAPAQSPNFCAATARRLLEIERRNELRREAALLPLPIVRVLRRIKQQEDAQEFERFEAAHGKAIWEEILKPRREVEGNPNWRPTWMEGMQYENQVRSLLRKRYRAGLKHNQRAKSRNPGLSPTTVMCPMQGVMSSSKTVSPACNCLVSPSVTVIENTPRSTVNS